MFPHINDIISTCGQSIFTDDASPELQGIPREYVNPPIKITSNNFKIGISENSEKTYSIASLHPPLNITLETISPIAWVFNCKTLADQYRMLNIILSRTPIILIDNGYNYIFNWMNFIDYQETIYNAFFEIKDGNTINKENYAALKLYMLKPNTETYIDGKRIINPLEKDNEVYNATYNDGQFTGFVSPQPNDFYTDNEENINSDFNNCSLLKCLFQITMLGIVYSNNYSYTLDNACILLTKTTGGGFKYTGKYWKKSVTAANETQNVLEGLIRRIRADQELQSKIKKEIGVEVQAENWNKTVAFNVKIENGYDTKADLTLYNRVIFSKNLFTSTLGLEDYDKMTISLFISGVLGHTWDYLLRFFKYSSNTFMEKEASEIKKSYPAFQFIKHLGTPLASYIYDYKTISEQQILGGYNSLQFGRLLNNGILKIRDNVRGNTIYTPRREPNAIFPITFNNLLLECNTKCYRSYKKLLNYMKTRKQRNLLFENLSHYGRRCMTVLDPYGIFMHFQNINRGLVSSDK